MTLMETLKICYHRDIDIVIQNTNACTIYSQLSHMQQS